MKFLIYLLPLFLSVATMGQSKNFELMKLVLSIDSLKEFWPARKYMLFETISPGGDTTMIFTRLDALQNALRHEPGNRVDDYEAVMHRQIYENYESGYHFRKWRAYKHVDSDNVFDADALKEYQESERFKTFAISYLELIDQGRRFAEHRHNKDSFNYYMENFENFDERPRIYFPGGPDGFEQLMWMNGIILLEYDFSLTMYNPERFVEQFGYLRSEE